MRLFYKYTDEKVIEVTHAGDGKESTQTKTLLTDVQPLVTSGSAIIYDTISTLNASMSYTRNRRDSYPDVEEQFDQIYHEGIDAWKATI